METETKIHASIGHENYMSRITARGHVIHADEPIENGGKDLGPSSTELVLSGLATCTTSTLRMYADRKGWGVDRITVHISLHIDRNEQSQQARIYRTIEFEGNLDDTQKQRLLQIADKCPTYKLLTNPIQIVTNLAT